MAGQFRPGLRIKEKKKVNKKVTTLSVTKKRARSRQKTRSRKYALDQESVEEKKGTR